MKLLRLRVVGLRSFTRETEIDLERLGEQGLFAICGPTGAGKSTILDGIFLALFGRCPRGEAGECVSAGARELGVRLTLVVDRGEGAREMAVERRFRWGRKRVPAGAPPGTDLRGAPRHPPLRIEERAADGAFLPADLGGLRAEEYLAAHIVKVSMSDFQQAVVLPQGQFDALLRARPGERRTLVASLFRTEHLGAPLLEVLRAREGAVRGEMGRLEEAEREVLVSEEDARAAQDRATQTAADARVRAEAEAAAEHRAGDVRRARERCAARDAAEAALAGVAGELARRAPDRERVARGRRAAGAEAAATALETADAAACEAEARATEVEAEALAAAVRRKTAERALEVAGAARAAELPDALEQLGRARQALERGRDLRALDTERAARALDLRAAETTRRGADEALLAAAQALSAAEARERAAAVALDAVRVGEDERAEAVAAGAVAEHASAEERLAGVIAAELAAAEEAVRDRGTALAAAEEAARAAEADAARARAELRRRTVDAQRATDDVDLAERAHEQARRAAAAADLADRLRPGEACPVCGAREHPGADHRLASMTIGLAERGVTTARRAAKAAEQARVGAADEASARDEDVRVLGARVDTALEELAAARAALSRQASGEEVPRAVAEARAATERLADRAELALSGVAADRQAAVREAARRAPPAAVEARIAVLNRRAREAEALGRTLAAAQDGAERARSAHAARGEARDRAERARAVAEERAAAAASRAEARREEIQALLTGLVPRGQRDLFAPARARGVAEWGAAEWVAELEARAGALARGEDEARVALEEARALGERLGLAAREASVRRGEARAQRERAGAAAAEALGRAGFESLAALRAALVDPALLARLEADLARLTEEHARLGAVLAERRRDAGVEVSEADARAAEEARDVARREAAGARERAAEAAVLRDELGRRRARAAAIRARIDELAPRARRLGQIRHVVSANQLSELAAERHLEAVTRGAALLLAALSSERYALVRTADGAFAVADAAHGGLVRPPSTLSGGETFLVSLALALSLSERIQLAGRTRFDFFFLDEGFGSLDPATLEVALSALERLRGPSRVIAMISHVGAIEERMPRRLRVVTERQGRAATVVHEP